MNEFIYSFFIALMKLLKYMIVSGGIFDDGWVTGSLVKAPWPATMSVDYVRAWKHV